MPSLPKRIWDRTFKPAFVLHRTFMLRRLGKYSPQFRGRVLDVGAGYKPYAHVFTETDAYLGTNALSFHGPETAKRLTPYTDVCVDDGSQLPFRDASFDGVLALQILSVVESPGALFREVGRVLTPDGLFLATTDFLYPKWSGTDAMRHTDYHLRRLAEQNELEVVAIESFGGFWTTMHMLLIHFLRNYAERRKEDTTLGIRCVRTVFHVVATVTMPLIRLAGVAIYHYEKDRASDFTYTMNNLILMRKPPKS